MKKYYRLYFRIGIVCSSLVIILSFSIFLNLLYSNKIIQYTNTPFSPLDPEDIPEYLKPIYSESIVIMEEKTASTIFSKNPNILFPPASLTKLVTLYMIYEKIHQGKITKNTVVPISLNAWAKNLPIDSSLMFLEPGQIVTIYELMLGLAIPSGNDAAVAIAEYFSGSMPEFVKDMNSTMKSLGLNNIHFEDANGYSSNNYITAADFVKFVREYVYRFPESIEDIHMVDVLNFPTAKNYPKGLFKRKHTISQKNHNPLIGSVDGIEGLKTGYIGKSGFNVAISVKRGNLRFLGVQLGSFAGTAKVANNNRVDDLAKIIDYLYDTYKLYSIPQEFYIQKTNLRLQAQIPHQQILHYANIVKITPELFTNHIFIHTGDTVGRLILEDELGNKAYYPLIANNDFIPDSLIDKLFGWLFKIFAILNLKS